MIIRSRPSRLSVPLTALAILSFVLTAGCGDDEGGGSSGGGGSASASTTGSNTPATTGSSTGEGGTTTSSSGDGGAGGLIDGVGGCGGAGCGFGGFDQGGGGAGPVDVCDEAFDGGSCDVEDETCERDIGSSDCEEGRPQIATCVDGHWETRTALSCGVYEPAEGCDLPGTYLVEPSGPFDPPDADLDERYGNPFEITFEVREDGRLYVDADGGSFGDPTCEVTVRTELSEDCEEIEGESFCTYYTRYATLDLTTDPGTGEVEVECYGECDFTITAPATVTRQ